MATFDGFDEGRDAILICSKERDEDGYMQPKKADRNECRQRWDVMHTFDLDIGQSGIFDELLEEISVTLGASDPNLRDH